MRKRESEYSRQLSDLEATILGHMMMGRSGNWIASELGKSLSSVHGSCHLMYNKLGADNRVQAVIFGMDLHVLDQYWGFWGS